MVFAACGTVYRNTGPMDETTPDDNSRVTFVESSCQFEQPFPYSSESSYVGVHANRENNDRIYCDGPRDVRRTWSALPNRMVFQPISFSADGGTIYATVPHFEDCTLYAVDVTTGEELWCSDAFTVGVSAGTVITDVDGHLYLTDGDDSSSFVYSLYNGGEIRWQTSLEDLYGGPDPATHRTPAGLHFTPSGYVATVTVDGVVVLLNRENGGIVTTFDIRGATGFVPARSTEPRFGGIPDGLENRLRDVLGDVSEEQLMTGMGAGFGGSGAFSDNTIGISALDQIFVVGGGPEPDTGSLVALNLVDDGPTPSLELAWVTLIDAGSATSPAISRDGTRVTVADGASHLIYVRVDECNDNLDADPEEEVCAAAWSYSMLGNPIIGSPAMDEHGVIYAWNSAPEPQAVDLFAIGDGDDGQPEVLWEVTFAGEGDTNRQWTSSATVLDDMVIGSVTNLIEPFMPRLGMPIMRDLSHEIVAVDRWTGEIIWRQPLPDDPINSLALGPDGAIYVPLIGFLDLTAFNEHIEYQGGIIRYAPVVVEE